MLLRTAELCVLIEALRALLRCFVELANAAPKFAPCAAGANAEDDFVRCSDAGFNLNTALLTSLTDGGGA